MRPGVGQESLEPVRKMLAQLHHQPVVVAIATGFHAVHAPIFRIDAVRQAISGSNVCANGVAIGIVDLVGDGGRRRPDIQIADRGQVQRPAPQPGGAYIPVPGDGVLDGEVALMGVRVSIVFGRNRQIHDRGCRRRLQHVGKNRAGHLVRQEARIQLNGRLADAVFLEERTDQAGLVARVEDPVPASDHGARVVEGHRASKPGRQVGLHRRNAPAVGIIRVRLSGLRQ